MAAPRSIASRLYTEILAAPRRDRSAIPRVFLQRISLQEKKRAYRVEGSPSRFEGREGLCQEKLTSDEQAAMKAGLKTTFLIDLLTAHGLLAEPIGLVPYMFLKRIIDVLVSAFLLALLAPLLCVIALLVRLDSPGPALFVQKRVGRNGELFDIFKFRSMHTTAPRYECSPNTSYDPRITRIGRFLRRSSLDELPQLLNVLLGNMSLVGPRPEMPFIVKRYTPRQRKRLQVTPGITGLWQLSADRAFPIHEGLHHDLTYIQNCTFFMDMAILLHTLFRAMRGV